MVPVFVYSLYLTLYKTDCPSWRELTVYTCVFCAVPAFISEHGRGSCRHPSLCSGSRSPGCDTSFELPFIAWVAFRLDFMAGIILHFIFIACVASSCFIAYFAFSCYGYVAFTLFFLGVCCLPVSHFWRKSLSLVSWCLSYFALHFVLTVDSLITDTSIRRTPRIGPCLCLFPLFDSL